MGAVNLISYEPFIDKEQEKLSLDCDYGISCVVENGKILLVTAKETIEITPEWHAKMHYQLRSVDGLGDIWPVKTGRVWLGQRLLVLRQLQIFAASKARWDVVDYISLVFCSFVKGSL